MNYKYAVIDDSGRLWVKTITRIKAARMVKELFEKKGIHATIQELTLLDNATIAVKQTLRGLGR